MNHSTWLLCALATFFVSDSSADAQKSGAGPTSISEHSWHVALFIETFAGEQFCSGALVSDQWIVTAAHCFDDTKVSSKTWLKLGVDNPVKDGNRIEAVEVILHPQYDPSTLASNIALVKFAKIEDQQQTTPIELPGSDFVVPATTPLEATGWSLTGNGNTAEKLQLARVKIIPADVCSKISPYGPRANDQKLCTDHESSGVDACAGDGGGPLIWRAPDGPKLIGVIGSREDCTAEHKHGVYMRVQIFAQWINDKISEDE